MTARNPPPVSRARWEVAQESQRIHQRRKLERISGREEGVARGALSRSLRVAALLDGLGHAAERGPIVEVGSGAHGLIWGWPGEPRLAVDPLAGWYRSRFAFLQAGRFAFLQAGSAQPLTAKGEALPVASRSARVLLSDNVLDHVQDPAAFLRECRRVLREDGVLFLTVDVHHPVWRVGARLYNRIVDAGWTPRVPAFPSHPFHFRETEVDRLLGAAGFRVAHRRSGGTGRRLRPRHLRRPNEALKVIFPKNVPLELVCLPRP